MPRRSAPDRTGSVHRVPRIRAASIEAHITEQRQDILATAARLFAHEGYGATTMGDIAAAMGVGRTTLYEYFESKEDIIVAVVETELPRALDQLTAGLEEGRPEERLDLLVRRLLRFMALPDNLCGRLLQETAALSRPAQRRVGRAHERLAACLGGILEAGASSGRFQAARHDVASRFVTAAVMAAARDVATAPDPATALAGYEATLGGLLLRGLAGAAPGPPT